MTVINRTIVFIMGPPAFVCLIIVKNTYSRNQPAIIIEMKFSNNIKTTEMSGWVLFQVDYGRVKKSCNRLFVEIDSGGNNLKVTSISTYTAKVNFCNILYRDC